MSRKLRIYVDTSVIGGVFDEEFKEWSTRLLDEAIRGEKILILSDLTLGELEKAPGKVSELITGVPRVNIEFVQLTREARELADEYIRAGSFSAKLIFDAQHIALATIAKVDALVSWNFRHVVNLERIRFYNSVNLRLGYPLIEIRTPREVVHEV